MKYLNKLAAGFCVAALGLMAMSSCDSKDLYKIDSPEWLSDSINAVKERNAATMDVLEDQVDDVYTFGNTDYSSGWWQAFSKYYVIPEGKKWQAMINLHINPKEETKYYQNFLVVFTNDYDRGNTNYKEYGVIRYDNDPSKNSEWGDYIDRSLIKSNLTMSSGDDDVDKNIQKLAGKVAITVDRTDGGLKVRYNNGTVLKTYTQETPLENLGTTNIRCFLVTEGAYVDFVSTNIEPIGGVTPKDDQQPIAITDIKNVPASINTGSDLQKVMENAKVTAKITFNKIPQPIEVSAKDLQFKLMPDDINTPGKKTLIILYNKTFKGENATTPVLAYKEIDVVTEIVSLEITGQPTMTEYNDIFSSGYPFVYEGLEVTATFSDGSKKVVDNKTLKFSTVPGTVGTHAITITSSNGKKASVNVKVNSVATQTTLAHPAPTTLGAVDNSGNFWSAHLTNDIKVNSGATVQVNFTNYSSMLQNYHNYYIVLRSQDKATEYAVLRADNFGWGTGYDACTHSGTQGDWAAWLQVMDGAHCAAIIQNVGDGTANVQIVMVGTDGKLYTQNYTGINTIQADNMYLDFTVEKSHLVFE